MSKLFLILTLVLLGCSGRASVTVDQIDLAVQVCEPHGGLVRINSAFTRRDGETYLEVTCVDSARVTRTFKGAAQR